MSLYKKKESGIYWIDITPPGGDRIRRSAGTKGRRAAQEYHDRLKADLWRQAKLGETPDHTFEEAAVRFLKLCEGQRDYAGKLRHIAWWRTQFAGRAVRSLKAREILDALPTHRTYKERAATALTGGTLNRYLNTMRRLLNLCREWEWIDRVPKLTRFGEPDVRVRWEPPEVIAALIAAPQLPWMRDAATVAVTTGMRMTEVLGLMPGHVHLGQRTARVTHEAAKSKRARSVPLNDDALAVIVRRMRGAAPDAPIITRGEGLTTRIRQIDKRDWRRACKLVGVSDFRWHDLRHTWASWHVQRGTPLMVLKELGGWETIAMVQKYAHLAPNHLAAHAANGTFAAPLALVQEQKAA